MPRRHDTGYEIGIVGGKLDAAITMGLLALCISLYMDLLHERRYVLKAGLQLKAAGR